MRMYSIIQYLPKALASCFGSVHISPLPTKAKGKLRLTPVQSLQATHAHQLAQFALHLSRCFYSRRLLPALREGTALESANITATGHVLPPAPRWDRFLPIMSLHILEA